MTDYEIQKATADKLGVLYPPDNIFGCRKAILEKLGGDSTNADTIYECDKRILPLIGSSSANLQEKSVNINENGYITYSPDSGFEGFSDFSVNVDVQPKLKEIEIVENGLYLPEKDSDGYNNIMVDVLPTPVQEKSLNITENGTNSIVPDSGYNLSKVDVDVKVPLKIPNGTKLGFSTFAVCPDYDFSDITDMSSMFYSCKSLTSIHLFDTSKVKSMSMLFAICGKLTSIPLFDTSNVTNMNAMFYVCSSLTSIPALDTSNVTDMGNMFNSCSILTSIPALDTSNVANMSSMFESCEELTDLGGFKNIGKAFTSSQTLDISYSPLTNQSVQNLIDTIYDMNLNTQGGSATLKLKQTVIDAMTDTQKSQLAAKGWTLTN